MTTENIEHFFSDGVYAKKMTLPKDHFVVTHQHNYDHLSVLAQGRVVVVCDGVESNYTGPTAVTIKAGVNHKIIAIEDSCWFCIHATEETDINKVDKTLIKENK